MDRKKTSWTVALQGDNGEVIDRTISAYWSPEHETTKETVGITAAAEAWYHSGKKINYMPIGISRP